MHTSVASGLTSRQLLQSHNEGSQNVRNLRFQLDSYAVRTLTRDGEPWFVAADVCEVLTIGNTTKALLRLDEDEQALISIQGTHSGPGNPMRSPALMMTKKLMSALPTSAPTERHRAAALPSSTNPACTATTTRQ